MYRNAEMGQRGFSLVELVVVIVIIGALLAIGTLQFTQYTKKSGIEAQVKTMYADIMNARSEALLQKSDRSVSWTASQFSVYPNSTATDPPLLRKTLSYPITSNDMASIISFDTKGMASISK